MNLRFDHTHYVPVLRFKRSEKVALRELGTQSRAGITPLLEIVQTADYRPQTVANEIRTHWGPYPFFLDLHHLVEAQDGDLMLRLNGAIVSHGLLSIPVIGLHDGRQFQQAVSMVVALDKRGVCIRLFPEDLERSSIAESLERLVNNLGVVPEQVDLIADCRLISEFNPTYEALCHRVPALKRWRTFTVISGAFSQDLSDYKKNAQYERNRDDWLAWKNQIFLPNLQRYPTHGDYTIQYPLLVDSPPAPDVSASIRYTSSDYWVIMRGEGMRTGIGNAQYAANAELLCGRPEFCGAPFSSGDRYIYNLYRRLGRGPGSPETLLRAGINHHVTFVVDQISKLFGTSTGDEPFLGYSPSQQLPPAERRPTRAPYNGLARPPQARPTK
jgi:hypothetical protein